MTPVLPKEPAGETKAPYRLIEEIVVRSVAGNWHEAKNEWLLSNCYLAPPEQLGTCACGHFPIREHCVLVNRKNGNWIVVGNCCVRRFIGQGSENIFKSLRRIARDNTKVLGKDAVDHAYRAGWLSHWEHQFCLSTHGKRGLSARQLAIRVEINRKVLRLAMRKVESGVGHASAQ
jgi:hypothetical protein